MAVSYNSFGALERYNAWNRGSVGRAAAVPADPQLLNRYAYSRNNPVTYYDPSGEWVWIAVGGIVGGAIGFGSYAWTHQDNFNWGEAAVWTGGGALAGSGIGLIGEAVAAGGLALGGSVLATEGVAFTRFAQTPQAQTILQRFGTKLPAQSFQSFEAMKRVIGPAGANQQWHHIVGQTEANIARFGIDRIQNAQNVVRLASGPGSIHQKISDYYSSTQPQLTGSKVLTVREWLMLKDFDYNYKFGIQLIERFLEE